MFEKEAEEYGHEHCCDSCKNLQSRYRKVFRDGAEFGYNKANEWHKVADGDLPKEYTEVLNDDGVKVIRINEHWRYVYGDEWEDDAHVDHWCEIPEYKE